MRFLEFHHEASGNWFDVGGLERVIWLKLSISGQQVMIGLARQAWLDNFASNADAYKASLIAAGHKEQHVLAHINAIKSSPLVKPNLNFDGTLSLHTSGFSGFSVERFNPVNDMQAFEDPALYLRDIEEGADITGNILSALRANRAKCADSFSCFRTFDRSAYVDQWFNTPETTNHADFATTAEYLESVAGTPYSYERTSIDGRTGQLPQVSHFPRFKGYGTNGATQYVITFDPGTGIFSYEFGSGDWAGSGDHCGIIWKVPEATADVIDWRKRFKTRHDTTAGGNLTPAFVDTLKRYLTCFCRDKYSLQGFNLFGTNIPENLAKWREVLDMLPYESLNDTADDLYMIVRPAGLTHAGVQLRMQDAVLTMDGTEIAGLTATPICSTFGMAPAHFTHGLKALSEIHSSNIEFKNAIDNKVAELEASEDTTFVFSMFDQGYNLGVTPVQSTEAYAEVAQAAADAGESNTFLSEVCGSVTFGELETEIASVDVNVMMSIETINAVTSDVSEIPAWDDYVGGGIRHVQVEMGYIDVNTGEHVYTDEIPTSFIGYVTDDVEDPDTYNAPLTADELYAIGLREGVTFQYGAGILDTDVIYSLYKVFSLDAARTYISGGYVTGNVTSDKFDWDPSHQCGSPHGLLTTGDDNVRRLCIMSKHPDIAPTVEAMQELIHLQLPIDPLAGV